MARPNTYGERVTTAIRLPAPVHHRLRECAAARDVSANLLVTRAITDYLDRLPPVDAVLGATGTEDPESEDDRS